MKNILLFLLLIAATACSNSGEQAVYEYKSAQTITNNPNSENFYSIKKFVDGDTYWINDGSKDGLKIRLIGINAPEPRNYFKKHEEPYGKEASAFIKKLIGNKKVSIELDVQERDRYGRVLAYSFFEDGRFVNEEMVKNGYAEVATYPPNVKYEKRLFEAQKYARENRLGMWSDL